MNKEDQDLIIELELLSQICTFHDLDDKKKREKYAKEYFDSFCEKTGIDPEYALSKIEEYLKFKRENTMYKYEHFKDMRRILKMKDNKNEER